MDSRALATVALLLIAHLTLAALTPHAMQHLEDFFFWMSTYFLVGVPASQIMLIAIWAAFAPGHFVWRWACAALLGTLQWAVIVVSVRIVSEDSVTRDEMMLLGVVLFGGLLASYVACCSVAKFEGYRLHAPSPTRSDEHRFALRKMFGAVALLSLSLGAARWVLPEDKDYDRILQYFDVRTASALATVCVFNLFIFLPVTWIALTRQIRDVWRWALGFVGYSLVLSALTATLAQSIGIYGVAILIVSFWLFGLLEGISIAITLGILRAAGFTWQKRQELNVAIDHANPQSAP